MVSHEKWLLLLLLFIFPNDITVNMSQYNNTYNEYSNLNTVPDIVMIHGKKYQMGGGTRISKEGVSAIQVKKREIRFGEH